jgi:hypothetical protein
MSRKVTVYRFIRELPDRTVSPMYMAGTLEAIEALGGVPIVESARDVEAKLLDGGFYYEHTPTGALQNVELPPPDSGGAR